MTTQKHPAELVIETSFGVLRIPCTARVHEIGTPPAASFRATVGTIVDDVRDYRSPEYSAFDQPAPKPTDAELRETIRRGRRAVMPDPTERDKPKSKAELDRRGRPHGKLCKCGERCGPRTKICMCGHNFYQNGAA